MPTRLVSCSEGPEGAVEGVVVREEASARRFPSQGGERRPIHGGSGSGAAIHPLGQASTECGAVDASVPSSVTWRSRCDCSHAVDHDANIQVSDGRQCVIAVLYILRKCLPPSSSSVTPPPPLLPLSHSKDGCMYPPSAAGRCGYGPSHPPTPQDKPR